MKVSVMRVFATLIILNLIASVSHARPGSIRGGENYSIPDWFKLSLLNLAADAKEASTSRKHVLLFMHLKACPYCARMIKENFISGSNKGYMQKNFDVIAIDIRGDKEVTWKDGKTYTETGFAKFIGVVATPTIVFLDTHGNKVLQLNGYRMPAAFRDSLEYVHGKHYKTTKLADFTRLKQRKAVYTFLPHPHLKTKHALNKYRNPIAVIFENRNCVDCKQFHQKVLNHPAVLKELDKYLLVRFDTYSNKPIVTPSGEKITPAVWAKQLGLNYSPGTALYTDGKLVSLINGRYYHFHFKEQLRYVSGKHFLRYPAFSQYLKQRQRQLLKNGVNIDLSE